MSEIQSATYHKKPVEVQATRWFKNGDHPDDRVGERVIDVDGSSYTRAEGAVVRFFRHPDILGLQPCVHCGALMYEHGWIDAPDKGHIVCPGDWVVTGVRGELYPCKPDIFVEMHEPVTVAAESTSDEVPGDFDPCTCQHRCPHGQPCNHLGNNPNNHAWPCDPCLEFAGWEPYIMTHVVGKVGFGWWRTHAERSSDAPERDIPDAAIEATARTLVGWVEESWDDYDAGQRDNVREGARAALEAARPHLVPAWGSNWTDAVWPGGPNVAKLVESQHGQLLDQIAGWRATHREACAERDAETARAEHLTVERDELVVKLATMKSAIESMIKVIKGVYLGTRDAQGRDFDSLSGEVSDGGA